MSIRSTWVLAVAAGFVMAGCASQQEPATKAVEAAQVALSAIREQASQYAPDQLKAVDGTLERLQGQADGRGLLRRADRRADADPADRRPENGRRRRQGAFGGGDDRSQGPLADAQCRPAEDDGSTEGAPRGARQDEGPARGRRRRQRRLLAQVVRGDVGGVDGRAGRLRGRQFHRCGQQGECRAPPCHRPDGAAQGPARPRPEDSPGGAAGAPAAPPQALRFSSGPR